MPHNITDRLNARWRPILGWAALYAVSGLLGFLTIAQMWRSTQNGSDHIAIAGVGVAILFGLVTLGQLVLGFRQTALARRQDDILLRRANLHLTNRSSRNETLYLGVGEVALAILWWNVVNDGSKTANSAAVVFYVGMEPAEYVDDSLADSLYRLNVIDNTRLFEHLGAVTIDGEPYLMFQHQLDKPIYPRIEREAMGFTIRPMVARPGHARVLWQVVCDDGTFPETGFGETHLEFYLPGSPRHRELQRLRVVPEDPPFARQPPSGAAPG